MSEIREYRGKRVDTGEWVYGYCFEEIGCFIKERPSSISTNTFLVDPSTIGQYTGLKDKNGIKIFEGDMVRQNYEITLYRGLWQGDRYEHTEKIEADIQGYHVGEVVIIPSKGVCIRNPISHDSIDDREEKIKRYVNIASYRCEVIGNIHESEGGE